MEGQHQEGNFGVLKYQNGVYQRQSAQFHLKCILIWYHLPNSIMLFLKYEVLKILEPIENNM